MWKDFFHFTKKEKQGIIALIILISGIFIGKQLFSVKKSDSITTVEQSQSQQKEESSTTSTENKTNSTSLPPKQLHFFDPNTADSISLIRLGLKPYVVRNIVKYRSKGGKFHRSEDFKKIYGMNPNQAKELEAYVKIESANTELFQQPVSTKESSRDTSTAKTKEAPIPIKKEYPTTEKYKPGTTVNINTADTSELKKIPGIGGSFASRIIKYRQILGGFYSTEQVKEVYGMDEEKYTQIAQWIKTVDEPLQLIPVNKCSLDKLKSHPYINFYQAKAIVELRKKKGKIDNIEELSLMEEFASADLERIRHYLSFE